MAVTKVKPTYAWGFEKENGTFYGEAFSTKSSAVDYKDGNPVVKDYKLVRVQLTKYVAKKK